MTASRDQIKPQPLVRSVSSVAFAILTPNAFSRAVETAVHWMMGLNPAIPESAVAGEPIDVGGGGNHPARAISLTYPEGRIWSATIDNPDANVLGRTWVTEITVAERIDEVHVGVRLLNVTRQFDAPFTATIPRVTGDMIRDLTCIADGIRLSDQPTIVSSEADLDELIELLNNPKRRLPVVVTAEAVTRGPFVNPEVIAKRLSGAAHVFFLEQAQTWQLTRSVGRALSVFDGATRLYWPGFDVEESDPFDHPLWLPTTDTQTSSGAPVVARALSRGVSKGTTDYPRFDAVRQAVAQQALNERRADTSDTEMLRLYEEENSALRAQLESLRREHNQWLADAEIDRTIAEREISELKADRHRYRRQNEALLKTINLSGARRDRVPLVNFSTFGDWASENISPNIWFAPKAIKEIEGNGQYRSPADIGRAIYLLDEVYVPMRREPNDERHEAWEAGLTELGLTLDPCFSRQGDIKRFPEYSVTYRTDRYWCDLHIKCGGGTDPRSMFRIYFCWHEDHRIILVGHLPSHLDNNLTN